MNTPSHRYGGFHQYLHEMGTLTSTDYTTGIKAEHFGKIMCVENNSITILKPDGSHVTGAISNLVLQNATKFFR